MVGQGRGRRKWQKSFNIWVTELPFRSLQLLFLPLLFFWLACWIFFFFFFLLQHRTFECPAARLAFHPPLAFTRFPLSLGYQLSNKDPKKSTNNLGRMWNALVGWKLVVTPTLRNLSHWCAIWSAVPGEKLEGGERILASNKKTPFFFFLFFINLQTPIAYQLGWLIAFGFLTVFFAY